MKIHLKIVLVSVALAFTGISLAQTPEEAEELQLYCADYWNELEAKLTDAGLRRTYFTLRDVDKEIRDICNIRQSELYPNDEIISIRIYNHYYKRMALEEYNDEKLNSEGIDGYMVIPDLGDDAFAIRRVKFGRLASVIIEVIKGNVTIHFDINGNYADDSNNRFTPTSVFDFARAIVEPIPTND